MTEELEFKLDTTLYPLEAIQNACYTFTDRAYVRIASGDGTGTCVSLKLKQPGADGIEALSGEFHNELLHQALRLKVSQANQKIREFVVTKALVSAQPGQAAAEAGCPQCEQPAAQDGAAPAAAQGAPAPVDAELEAEIEKLLAEIEKSDGEADPLKVAVPWEETHAKAAPAAKKKRVKKGAA